MSDWADKKAAELVARNGPLHEALLAESFRNVRRAAIAQASRILRDQMLETAARVVDQLLDED